jgi:hypothetical protein
MDTRVNDVEKACSFTETELERSRSELKESKSLLVNISKKYESLEHEATSLKKLNTDLNDKILDLEQRSMRDNLIFYNIPEAGDDENCENLVKTVLKDTLEMETEKVDNMIFDRAHRLGKKGTKARPIVVKFHYYKDKEHIRNLSFEKADVLKAAKRGIGIQLPKDTRESRKGLYPAMETAKAAGKEVKFIGKDLYINDRKYVPNKPSVTG